MRVQTEKTGRVRASWLVLGWLALGCGQPATPAPQPSAAPAPVAQPQPLQREPKYEPPQTPFKAPQPWQSRKPGTPPLQPPDLEPEVWRVFVTQNQPLQIKTPVWQTLPPKDHVQVKMPEGSRFQCQVSPLAVAIDQNDFSTKLKAWIMTRTLTCSDDAWKSWTEYSHGVRLAPDGTRQMLDVPEALLRERMPDGSVKQTFVVLRSDKENREATTGPPRILTNRIVDED